MTDRCVVSGLGVLEAGDLVAGRARGGDVGASGRWSHVGADRVVLAQPEWITCRINGALLGDFGGQATIDGDAGYEFRVHVQDFGEPRPPELVEGPTTIETVSATRTYRPSRWEDGALEIADRALVTIPTELPVTTGNAGNRWAWVTFQRSETFDVVTCRYRGGASRPNPCTPEDLAGGESYFLERCTGELGGTDEVEGGDRVDVRWMTLHVHTGAHTQPSRHDARTTVTVDFEVTPLIVREPRRDYYRLLVWDQATGEQAYFRDGDLALGDLRLVQLD